MESTEMKNIARRDARLLVDALSLFTRLVEIAVQADEAGELHEGHRLLRITSKARDRYLRIRSTYNATHPARSHSTLGGHMATDYYSSVNEWLKAGRPLDKPFLIMREHTMDAENASDKNYVLNMLRFLCILIIRNLAYYRDELEGSGYHIEPALSVFHPRTFEHEGETFSVYAELPVFSDQVRVQFSIGAVATILSGSNE